jgi:DNA-binding NtrC family response regulator
MISGSLERCAVVESIKVLTVDNEASACDVLTRLVDVLGFDAEGVTEKAGFLSGCRRFDPDLLLFGSNIQERQLKTYADLADCEKRGLPKICIGGDEKILKAMGLTGDGGLFCLPKDFQPNDLKNALNNLLQSISVFNRLAELDKIIIGQTPGMTALKRHVLQGCDSDLTVLICGESGTGKEVVARAIHRFSPRADKPFVKFNSAGVPLHLFESELFGYEKGAFTGAFRRKPGKFQLAHSGTIFLDEIGEMPLPLQAKLLQVLEDNELSPLGSTKNTKIDTRTLAATNASLDAMVAQKRFRLDLFYRLSVISIQIPPLRHRREDVEPLSRHFLKKYAIHYNKPYRPLPEKVLQRLMQYEWPGNVRQLENAIRCFVAMGNADAVVPRSPEPAKTYTLKEVCRRAVRKAEKDVIEQVLSHTDWNRKKAASLLKTSYRNLLNKIKEYDIDQQMIGFQRSERNGSDGPWRGYYGYRSEG